jgi:HD-GYP domain-containing protein (c-di-GMP phosphodiesterase class II)/DNA-binding CsgD family transcriptional regulator
MTPADPARSTERGPTTLGELLLAFSTVTSVGLGFGADHGTRTCYIGMCVAAALELPPHRAADVYYTALMKDGGCTCGTSQMAAFLGADEREALAGFAQLDPDNDLQMLRWLFRHAGRGSGPLTRVRRTVDALVHGSRFERDTSIAECEVAQRVAERLGLSDETRGSLAACTERWDGKGHPYALAGEAIPLVARIVNLSAAAEIADRFSGQDGAIALVRQRSGKAFDPTVASAFIEVAASPEFWAALAEDGLRERLLAMEPDSVSFGNTEALDAFTDILADLVDLKRPATAGHARRAAALSDRVAGRIGLPAVQRVALRRAALIHSVGLVAISAHALARNAVDAAYRAHPLVAGQLLGELLALQPACELAALHHERLDGSGWPAGVDAARQPLTARVLAAVCAFDELTGGDTSAAAEAIQTLANTGGLDPQVLDALAAEAGTPRVARTAERPAGLTEREVEVLRLAAVGLSLREIGQRLVISHHTARHHLESAYGKIGCSSRAAAALFAAEHGLLD